MMQRAVRIIAYLSHLLLIIYPAVEAACQLTQGPYQLRWALDSKKNVHFLLRVDNYPTNVNTWTGVAFGESMRTGLDIAMVRVLDNRIWLNDEYVNGYRQPFVDPTQDLSLKSTSFINGALQIEFSRPVYTGDIGDWSLAGCIPWQFITTPGPLGRDGSVHKHYTVPYKMVICINRCPCANISTADHCIL